MTTTEHLQLIKKECERLLALSEMNKYSTTERVSFYDSAEAGWRSTIWAIHFIQSYSEIFSHPLHEITAIKDILAAWPIELLTKERL